jgi:hypothetical protein
MPATKSTDEVGTATIEDRFHGDSAGHAQINTSARSGFARIEPQLVTRLYGDWLPERDRLPVQPGAKIGAGERDCRVAGECERRPGERDLERGLTRLVAEQAIAQDQSGAIERASGRDAEARVATAAEILDRRQEAGGNHL